MHFAPIAARRCRHHLPVPATHMEPGAWGWVSGLRTSAARGLADMSGAAPIKVDARHADDTHRLSVTRLT